MCGIAVVVSSSVRDLAPAIDRMVAVQHHRGPDGHGTLVATVDAQTTIALGHNRLSIIDLSANAAQPMRSRDGRYVLVYNGEVYNYRELSEQVDPRLLPPGDSCGDTAVVLAMLASQGPAALSAFNGMWALALYDTHDQTLLIARDRFGVKPLYLYGDGNTVYFASEIKAILAATGRRFRVNPDAAIPYLTRGLANTTASTFFENIEQFPAASYQVLDLRREATHQPKPVRYWYHPSERGEEPVPGRIQAEEVRTLFIDAVKLRLRSDVPVGVLLSGGVDSSAIVGGASQLGVLNNLSVLSVTSDDADSNEEPFIDLMADWVKLQPAKINVSNDADGLFARLDDASWFNDAPIRSVAAVAHMRMMELARARGLVVLLSGQGADEQLGGYNKFFYFWLLALIHDKRYGQAARTALQFARHGNLIREFRLTEALRYVGARRLSSRSFIPPDHHHRDRLGLGLNGSYSKREWADLSVTSVPALLHYEDRMSMSQSVEVRVPFLDVRLVECLARVHPSEKFANGWTKAIFRTAMTGMLPPGIQYRRDKRGFTVPEERWLRGQFRSLLLETFARPMRAESLGLVDRPLLRQRYDQFLAGRGYLTPRHFFRAYALEVFLRRFERHLTG